MLEINIVNSYLELPGKIGTYQIDDSNLNLSIVISAKVYKKSKLDLAVKYGLITKSVRKLYEDISNDFIKGNIELEAIKVFPILKIPPAIDVHYQQSVAFLKRILLGYRTEGDIDMVTIKEWIGDIPYTGDPETVNDIIQMYTDKNKIILITY